MKRFLKTSGFSGISESDWDDVFDCDNSPSEKDIFRPIICFQLNRNGLASYGLVRSSGRSLVPGSRIPERISLALMVCKSRWTGRVGKPTVNGYSVLLKSSINLATFRIIIKLDNK